jgi:hypothetical protein
MKKTFEIKYYQYEDEDYDSRPYPATTDLSAQFTFDDGCTWDVVLWQFCKFLEMTGYEGVRNKIRLDDPLGFMRQNHLFECIVDEEESNTFWGEYDAEEDEEEDTDEGKDEVSFQDIKKEIQ